MLKELRALQKENAQLMKLVDEQALNNQILKEAAKGDRPCLFEKGPSGGGGPSVRSAVNRTGEGLGASSLPGAGPVLFYAALCSAAPGR